MFTRYEKLPLKLHSIIAFQCVLLAGCFSSSPNSLTRAQSNLGPNQYEVFGQVYEIMKSNAGYREIGVASWYGKKFHGRLTAMGETYDMFGLTAAHKTLPLPTVVKVTNLDNGQSITLRVNDRGPFHDDRLIDLSWGAARALGFHDKGIAPVVVEAVDSMNNSGLAEPARERSYFLQVGAFSSRARAETQEKKLRLIVPQGVSTSVLVSETAMGFLYKVWIGPLEDLKEEKLVAESIRDLNLGSALRVVVQ